MEYDRIILIVFREMIRNNDFQLIHLLINLNINISYLIIWS